MDTLYHYCANQTFLSIVTNKSIWLSSLSLSNDTMEGRIFNEIFSNLHNELDPARAFIEGLYKDFNAIYENYDFLGFCLSEEPDLLSQWRGYADDGAGISIGFSKNYFEKLGKQSVSESDPLGFSVGQVIYDSAEQKKKLDEIYDKMMRVVTNVVADISDEDEYSNLYKCLSDEKHKKVLSELHATFIATFVNYLYYYKINAFHEEKEWRLLKYYKRSDVEIDCSYRNGGAQIIPYQEYKLVDIEDEQPIKEIFLGPKNTTPEYVVRNLLKKHGFGEIPVKRSSATYR